MFGIRSNKVLKKSLLANMGVIDFYASNPTEPTACICTTVANTLCSRHAGKNTFLCQCLSARKYTTRAELVPLESIEDLFYAILGNNHHLKSVTNLNMPFDCACECIPN